MFVVEEILPPDGGKYVHTPSAVHPPLCRA